MIQFKIQAEITLKVLFQFIKNPIEGMRHLPQWEWPILLTFQAAMAAVAGAGAGFVAKSISGVFTGLIFVPVSNALISSVVAGFFFYTFMFVFNQPVNFLRMYTHVVFAQIPALAIYCLTPLLPPLVLLGPAAAGLLLIVGFTDNFGLERKKATKFIGTVFAIFCILWILNSINYRRQIESFSDKVTPESMDKLEEEMKR